MEERVGYIYRLTSPSGKSYIGQTIQDPERRWADHVRRAHSNDDKERCPALSQAIIKYGWDNFTKEILSTCKPEELDDQEILYINTHNTVSPNGYNLTLGGNGVNVKMSDETKTKMKNSALNSNRVYNKQDQDLAGIRAIRRWTSKRGHKYYRIETVIGSGDTRKRICESLNIRDYATDEDAKNAAFERLAEIRRNYAV